MATTVLYLNVSDVKLCSLDQKDDSYKEFYEIAQTVTGLVIYPLACIPGFLGNMLTIFVLCRRNMLTSTNAFLSALAVSDSIKLVNDIMYILVTVFLHTDKELGRIAYGYLYPYAHFIFSMSVCVSSWLTVSVAIERYILVCHPTRARAFWNRKRAVWLCVFIYVIMTILALPSALRYRTINCIDRMTNLTRLEVELTEIWRNQLLATTYEWIQNLLRSIIPLIVLVVLNVCIICALKRTSANRGRNPRHRVTIMMIVVILVFLICITPDAIMYIVFEFGYHEEGYLERGIREITDSLLTINAGVNFIIYCVFNQVFRKSFTRICCPTSRPVGWITELDESTYRRLSEAKYLLSTNNNSPPRRNTPPKARSGRYLQEKQLALNSGLVSKANSRKTHEEHKCSLNISSWHEISRQSSPLITSSSSSLSDNYISHNTQMNQQHLQHQYRASSGGLKKSRNSVKSNRAKNKAKVTFLENDEILEDFNSEFTQEEGISPKLNQRVQHVKHSSPIADLPCRISEENGSIADLPSRVSEQTGSIADLPSRVSEENGSIADLPSRVSEQRVSIKDLNSRDSEKLGSMEDCPSRASNKRGSIEDFPSRVLDNQVSKTDLASRVAGKRCSLTDLPSSVSEKRGFKTDLASRFSEKDGSIADMPSRISEQCGFIADLPPRVSEKRSSITGSASDVSGQHCSIKVLPSNVSEQHSSTAYLSSSTSDLEDVLLCNDCKYRTQKYPERKFSSKAADSHESFIFNICDKPRTPSKVRFKDYINGATDSFKMQPIDKKDKHNSTENRPMKAHAYILTQLYPDSKSENLVSQMIKSQDSKSENLVSQMIKNQDSKSENLVSQMIKSQDSKSDLQALTDRFYPDNRTMAPIKRDNNILTAHSPDSVVCEEADCFSLSYFSDQILTTDV